MIHIPKILRLNDGTINVEADGLRLGGRDSRFHAWDKIINIFPFFKPNYLVIIDNDGNVSAKFVYPDKTYGSVKQKIDFIFKTWQERIEAEKQPEIFEYPDWQNKSDESILRYCVRSGMFLAPVVMVMFIIAYWMIAKSDGKTVGLIENLMVALVLLVGLINLYIGVLSVLKLKKKKLSAVKFNGSMLEVIYNDSSNRICDLSQVKRHTLKDHYSKGKLVFRDGFVLENLERLSYWPILRRKIKKQLTEYIGEC